MECEMNDKYTAGIELSNKCREFYHKRMETAENVKQRLSPVPGKERKRSSIDTAMEKLGNEMASLMDQDLSLMKQLLTLNEAIEDLKWRSRNNSRTLSTSSCDLSESDISLSDTDMVFQSEDEEVNTNSSENHKCDSLETKCDSQTFQLDNSKVLNNQINDDKMWTTGNLLEEVSHKLLDLDGSCDSGINIE
ncbi:uncharacterized protein LOC143049730 [Mytilus galloprovincialis]|uniref:uncharacterized protein LOC143049730 n=1 Tax=Mytilus galloprovincialis TaxID=29158 RepID=UPI003F7BC6EE